MGAIQVKAVEALIAIALKVLGEVDLKAVADFILDLIEDTVASSETKWDDKTILPICNMIRSAFDIPDNDEVPEAKTALEA